MAERGVGIEGLEWPAGRGSCRGAALRQSKDRPLGGTGGREGKRHSWGGGFCCLRKTWGPGEGGSGGRSMESEGTILWTLEQVGRGTGHPLRNYT